MKRLALFLVVCPLCLAPVSAQGAEEVAEESLTQLASYAARINYFNHLCPQEKVYLHLDNTAYFQGETVWFAANVVNASTLGEAASKVLYVELLSPTGVVLKQQKLKVVEGRCHGSFSLIDNNVQEAVEKRGAIGYPSGYYQIRAYTRAMLNFDDAGIYSRVIPVYKAPEREGDYTDPVMRKYTGKETNRPEAPKADRFSVSFFPEGGHIITGMPCRIAFKAVDRNGHGVAIESLTDERGNALDYGTMHNGMGCFTCTATDTRKHTIKVRYEDKGYSFDLPAAEPEGYALQLHRTDNAHIDVAIAARHTEPHCRLAYTVTARGEVCAFDTLHLTPTAHPSEGIYESQDTLTLSTDGYPTGVCQFTLFNEAGTILASRLFFADNGGESEPLTVTAGKSVCQPFEEVTLHFRTATPAVNTFSLAVRDAADYGTAYRDDIRTYMLLSSELKGLIEEPAWYFGDAPKEERTAALDLLMMVQGWTRYNWRQMAGVDPFEVKHYTEEQLVLDGWAFSCIREEPLPGTKVTARLTSRDRQYKQKTTVTTDSLGYWSIGLDDFEGEWDLYLETRQPGKKGEKRTTRLRLERASRPSLYAYTPLETWMPHYAWDADNLLTVEVADDKPYQLPSDSHLLDEVEITGRRRYIDYLTFKAFDAEQDAEVMYDEGGYTYKVADYLIEKGYSLEQPSGQTFDDFMTYYDLEDGKKKYPSLDDTSDDSTNVMSRTIYYQWVSEQAPIDGYRVFWYIRQGDTNRSGPSFFDGYNIDLDEVKSIIVYDDPWAFMSFPPVREVMSERLIHYFHSPANGFPGGLRVVEIEIAPERRLRTKNNVRSTSFAGYSPAVEFYAPTYPNGPVQGDKDYRRTLYWNPEVTTDSAGCATLSFYNNGYSRSLTVSAEGLTKDGIPIIYEL
jgi:hypothetical protein